jgi:hypothetical protein
VHGYNGASIFGRTANTKEAANKLIQITKDYYPGLLASSLTKLFQYISLKLCVHILIIKYRKPSYLSMYHGGAGKPELYHFIHSSIFPKLFFFQSNLQIIKSVTFRGNIEKIYFVFQVNTNSI